MKPKLQYRTTITREASGSTTTIDDARFSLFYKNAYNKDNGLYSIIGGAHNTWDYNNDGGKPNVQHLPAENTVFINANIALTDGSSKQFDTTDKTPRTIPNLYDALSALAAKISTINSQIDIAYSTTDKHLYVTKDVSNNTVTISPGNGEDGKFADDINRTINNIKITSGNGATSMVISDNDVHFTIKPNGDTNNHTYTLGAIIEAIQELNRRTAFIDSTMKFNDAKTQFDIMDNAADEAIYGKCEDGLPAATDGHYSETLESNSTRSISNGELPKMEIITYNSETVDDTGKNIPFTQETSALNDNAILDDPTVISPESVTVRMRSCPYLLE